jgi:hypothetical protein
MIPTLITESFRYCYGNDQGIIPHPVAPSRAPASRAFGNGRDRKGMEGKGKTEVTLGLWLLVVETLIFIIISQRARPMMIRNRP